MNLIVVTRVEEQHVRFDVRGAWRYGDALALSYLIKAGLVRGERRQALTDLRNVSTQLDVEGRFLICDRLHRALPAPARIALLAPEELVDEENAPDLSGQGIDIACFASEHPALHWLRS